MRRRLSNAFGNNRPNTTAAAAAAAAAAAKQFSLAFGLGLWLFLQVVSETSSSGSTQRNQQYSSHYWYASAAETTTAIPDSRRNENKIKNNNGRSLYYQRYNSYPEYCSDPTEMATRGIPPLPIDDSDPIYGYEATQLVHATVVIRHGARTPVHSKNCWAGHWDAPDGIWDCKLHTVLAETEAERGSGGGENNDENNGNVNSNRNSNSNKESTFLVEKIYDAFRGDKLPSPYRNAMNGTCQDGQLLQQGYDQQVTNGRHLRRAYVVEPTMADGDDPRLGLLDAAMLNGTGDGANSDTNGNANGNANANFLEGVLRYRSDDDQRTLASGQILLASMLGPEVERYRSTHNGAAPVISHHTADRPNDVLSSKRGKTLCASQKRIIASSYASEAYASFDRSDESMVLQKMIEAELEPEGVAFGGIDCLMTSICTDRGLPGVLSDYGASGGNNNSSDSSSSNNDSDNDNDRYTQIYGPDRFERLVNYVIQNQSFPTRFNDAELSKMDMGPLWAELMDHIRPILAGKKDAVKLALYSGHDSTILPLMASLGQRVWNATDFPAYASMMILEIHEVMDKTSSDFPSGFAFRLVYNGRVLTWLLDGCPEYSHLCDVSVFVDRVTPFASRKNKGCGVDEDDPESGADTTGTVRGSESGSSSSSSSSSLSPLPQLSPVGMLLLLMVASFAAGSLATFIIVRLCRWRPRRKQRDESVLVSSTGNESFRDGSEEPDIVID